MPLRATSAQLDRITVVVHAVVRRASFQVESLHMDEAAAKHVPGRLRCQFELDVSDQLQIAEPIAPRRGEYHVRSSCIDERVAPDLFLTICRVLDLD